MLKIAFLPLGSSGFSALNSLATASCLNYLLDSPVSLQNSFISDSNTLEQLCQEFTSITKSCPPAYFYSDVLSPDYYKYLYSYYDQFHKLFNNNGFHDLSGKKLKLYAPPAPQINYSFTSYHTVSSNPFDALTEEISIINLSSNNATLCESVLQYADLIIINVSDKCQPDFFLESLNSYYYPFIKAGKRVFFILEKFISRQLYQTPYLKDKILNKQAYTLPDRDDMPELLHSVRSGTADEYFCHLFQDKNINAVPTVYEIVARHIFMLSTYPELYK